MLALSLDSSCVSIADKATQRLNSSTTSLDFRLSRPPDIIGPQVDLAPRNSACAQVLEQMRSLARSQRLTIFMPHTVLSKARLQSFCDGVTRLKALEKDADISNLYQGHEARYYTAVSHHMLMSDRFRRRRLLTVSQLAAFPSTLSPPCSFCPSPPLLNPSFCLCMLM